MSVKNFVDLEKIQTFFANMPSGLSVYLWGGEPLLHPRFREITSFFIEKGCHVSVNTNGYLLKNHMRFLVDSPIDALVVSFDGLGTIHDRIRRQEGLFQKAKEGLLAYIEATRGKTPMRSVIINFTVIPENYRTMEEFCEEVIKWDIKSITMNLPIVVDRDAGELFNNECEKKSERRLISWRGYTPQYKDAFDYPYFSSICKSLANKYGHFIRWSNENLPLTSENLKLYYERPSIPLPVVKKGPWLPKNAPCSKLVRGLSIDATGNIVLCPDFPDTAIGNISRDNLSDFINDDKYHLFGLYEEASPMCLRCPHRA